MNQNYLRQLLRDWGDWVDRAALHSGYPAESSIVSAKEAIQIHGSLKWQLPGGGSYRYALPNRHAILCFEMPNRLIPIHQGVLALPEEPKAVLTLWYAYSSRVDEKHGDKPRIWYQQEKAAYVGLTYNALQLRVARARELLIENFNKRLARATYEVIEVPIVE